MLAEVVFRAAPKRKGKTSDAVDATPIGRQVTGPHPEEGKRPHLRFPSCKVEQEIAHVLILIQIEYLYVLTTTYGLGDRVGLCFIPLELYAVVFTKQVACGETVVQAVADLNSVKQRSRQIKTTVKLATNVAGDFKILSGSGSKQKDEAQQRGEERRFCVHGQVQSFVLSVLFLDRKEG